MDVRYMPGVELAGAFYREAVRPLLDAEYPALPHAAALIGSGSEVLGFDDAMSTDHHFGPRVMLFLQPQDHGVYAHAVHALLARRLPYEFRGYSTNFSAPDPEDNGVQHLEVVSSGPINHRVEVHTVRGFFGGYLGIDPFAALLPTEWLTIPQQKLRAVTAGAVFHDDIELEDARSRLAWYPHDIWLYLMASLWTRIGQEEHLMGRAGLVGDEVGSALIGARLVRDVMRLCFLMEMQYAPYPKWFGTAFRQLQCAPALLPVLIEALHARAWQAREEHLVAAYETIARMHNALGLTRAMPETVRSFFGRPFRVIALHGFAGELLGAITEPAVRALLRHPPIGNIDVISDNTDLLENQVFRDPLRALYDAPV